MAPSIRSAFQLIRMTTMLRENLDTLRGLIRCQ